MTRVCVIQTDNRPTLDYLLKSQEVNKMFCEFFHYDYLFIEIDNASKFVNKQYEKIYVVNSLLQKEEYDVLVFLDSDAWIQNGFWLNDIIDNLLNDEKTHGCFSRDPYLKHNTYINSGSFIIKCNIFTKNMYNTVINQLQTDLNNNNNDDKLVREKNAGWCDQYYISRYVFENKDKFIVFVPEILNTPVGKILKHNWCKNKKMYDDLNETILKKQDYLTSNNVSFNIKEYLDCAEFPTIINAEYDYLI